MYSSNGKFEMIVLLYYFHIVSCFCILKHLFLFMIVMFSFVIFVFFERLLLYTRKTIVTFLILYLYFVFKIDYDKEFRIEKLIL
jgi:hypothetical protein